MRSPSSQPGVVPPCKLVGLVRLLMLVLMMLIMLLKMLLMNAADNAADKVANVGKDDAAPPWPSQGFAIHLVDQHSC